MTSTELCKQLGISPKTLYLWEQTGRMPKSSRDRRGWRTYTPEQVRSIRKIAGLGPDTAELHSRLVSKDGRMLSARNQIKGKVFSIETNGLLCEVVLRLEDGQEIVSIVTKNSVQRLGIKKGDTAFAVIKSTEVMLLK